MAFEQREGSGRIFRNEKKDTDNQPDYRGNCLVNGKEFMLSAWVKTSINGKKYFSIAFTEKQQQQEITQQYSNSPADDELPF